MKSDKVDFFRFTSCFSHCPAFAAFRKETVSRRKNESFAPAASEGYDFLRTNNCFRSKYVKMWDDFWDHGIFLWFENFVKWGNFENQICMKLATMWILRKIMEKTFKLLVVFFVFVVFMFNCASSIKWL